jgi:2',3'-cyclic-nucleotide 2'-phosphodiesterase (5'-nucleotidase family)
MGKFVTTRSVSRINAIGLTTQDTLTIDINSHLFDNIEIGDTIKTIKLSCHE